MKTNIFRFVGAGLIVIVIALFLVPIPAGNGNFDVTVTEDSVNKTVKALVSDEKLSEALDSAMLDVPDEVTDEDIKELEKELGTSKIDGAALQKEIAKQLGVDSIKGMTVKEIADKAAKKSGSTEISLATAAIPSALKEFEPVGSYSGLDLILASFKGYTVKGGMGILIAILFIVFILFGLVAVVFAVLPRFSKFKGIIMLAGAGVSLLSAGAGVLLLILKFDPFWGRFNDSLDSSVLKAVLPSGSREAIEKCYDAITTNILNWKFLPGVFGFVILGLLLVAVVMALLALIFSKSARAAVASAVIIGMSGMYAGVEFPVAPGEELIIGRDATLSHLIIDRGSEKVSRKHVGVSYNASDDVYIVVDYSSNGTFEQNSGRQLGYKVPERLPKGTTINLANPSNSFRLL